MARDIGRRRDLDMNVSIFTRRQKFGYIAGLLGLTALLLFTRTFPLVLFAAIPASIAVLLIMRRKLLRKLTKSRIMQVAYAELIEPITRERTRIVGTDDNGRPIERRETVVIGHKRRDIPLVEHIDPCYVDLQRYVSRKANPLVMVCGRSGMGKSELMKMLLLNLNGPKIIFSFKPNDAYLSLPYNVIDVSSHIPDPFLHADDFSTAYALTFPANLRGIMLSQVRAITKTLARDSKDWNQFRQNLERIEKKATDIQAEAIALIREQTENLAVGEGSFSIDLTRNTVLDFSRLDESAKTFYAEIALRQMWNLMTGINASFTQKPIEQTEKATIMMDEVHRLTQLYELDARSILDTIMRQVRQFGRLYAATQNYSDINDKFRNQFGTQLTFNTSSEQDLEAIRKIDPSYVWIVKELYQYEFIDLTYRVGNHGLVPIFQAELSELSQSEKPVEYSVPANVITTRLATSKATIDYEAIITEKLKQAPIWISGMASYFADNYGVDKDTAKLKVKDFLQKLVNADEVQRMKFDMVSGESVVLYFRKSDKDENESPFHRWMIRQAIENCDDVSVIHTATSGEALPDIELSNCYVECETSLKKRTDDLEQRVRKFSSDKPMIILVPNTDAAEKYQRFVSERVIVTTLKDFRQSIRSKARP
jgi:hypothetical protein